MTSFLPSPVHAWLRDRRGYLRARFERPRWLRPAPRLRERKVCFLACHGATDRLSPHTLRLAAAWAAHRFQVILIVAADRPASFVVDADSATSVAGILVRGNVGYDFGSWRAAWRAAPSARDAALLVLTNDSVYGPLDTFGRLLERVERSSADVVGMTDSFEFVHHLQSYCVFYKPSALRSQALERFWRPVRYGDRDTTIRQDELPLLSTLQNAGLAVEVLFPALRRPVENPTLFRWRELIADGFPFMKVQLLRDDEPEADITGWNEVLARHGYPPAQVVEHIGPRYAHSAAARAFIPAVEESASRNRGECSVGDASGVGLR